MIDTLLFLLAAQPVSVPVPVVTPEPGPTAATLAGSLEPLGPVPEARIDDDGEEMPDKRPEIKEALGTLKGHVKRRGDEDREAIAVIDSLLMEFPKSGPKDRAAIVKGLTKCLEAKRQETDEGTPNNMLYRAVAVALGEMGPESAKGLVSWIGDKRHRKDLVLQRDLIKALGKTQADTGIRTLVDLLNHHEATLQASAAEALSNFQGTEQKRRKDLFQAVLKVLTASKSATDGNINDPIARERYDTISAAMITTLQSLSGHTERRPEEWQRWWNKNKKKNWDEGA